MRRSSLLALVLALAWTMTAAAADKEPSFVKDVKPFLAKYCVECHGAAKPKAGFNLSTYEDLMKGGKKKKAVVAGKPDDSMLIRTMDGTDKKKMPPKKYAKQPTAKEVEVIKAWIKAGAKDDSASTALPVRPVGAQARRESDD